MVLPVILRHSIARSVRRSCSADAASHGNPAVWWQTICAALATLTLSPSSSNQSRLHHLCQKSRPFLPTTSGPTSPSCLQWQALSSPHILPLTLRTALAPIRLVAL